MNTASSTEWDNILKSQPNKLHFEIICYKVVTKCNLSVLEVLYEQDYNIECRTEKEKRM